MKSIYVITMFEYINCNNGFVDLGCRDTVGWFNSIEDAEKAIMNNTCDLWETCYDYGVIESVAEGLYGPITTRRFYQYNRDTCEYDGIDTPIELIRYHSFWS